MISLGSISRDIMFRDDAATVLTEHGTYTWNRAGTRIRCSGESCGAILEAPDGPDSPAVIAVFARHQAEQLPELPVPEAAPRAAPAPPVIEDPRPEDTTVPEASEPVADTAQAIAAPAPEQESEPAGEPMESAVEEKAAPKARRDTKALTATIAEINKGDRVAAGFNHPRYGQFTVMGTVVKGGAGLDRNQLSVGGWYINLNDRAAKHLQALTIVAAAGQHEYAIPKPSELTEHVGIGG